MVKEIYKATRYTGEHFEWKILWVCKETGVTKDWIDEDTIRIEECTKCEGNRPELMGTDEKYLWFDTRSGRTYKVPATHIKHRRKIIVTRHKDEAIFNYK